MILFRTDYRIPAPTRRHRTRFMRAAIGILLAISWGPSAPAAARTAPSRGVIAWVNDGDTVRISSGERVRIAGIDAPETQVGQAKCQREIERGKAATARARGLLQGRAVDIARVGKSYRRTVARLTLEGRDVAEILVANGVAQRWPHYAPKPDWCRDR